MTSLEQAYEWFVALWGGNAIGTAAQAQAAA